MTTRREQAHAILAAMLQADPALYERILDTPGFAFHFNALAKLARDEDPARQLLRNVIGSWRLAWDCSANPGHTEVEVAVLAAEQAPLEEYEAWADAEEAALGALRSALEPGAGS